MENYLGLPANAAAHGAEIDRLLGWVHWLMLLLFVGWALYFVYVLFRFRAKRQPAAVYEGTKAKWSKYVEVGVAVVEGILLVGFAIPAWARWVEDFPPEEEATVVRVVAQQFAWNVHYPGADGVFGHTDPHLVDDGAGNFVGLDRSDPAARDDVVVQNQLHLPVDKPVIVRLSSRDVIHSFFLPEMRVKQDAIPGMEIPVHFTPVAETPPGETWNIACAQLCGNSHYRMRGAYTIESPAAYQAWLAANAPPPSAPAAATPAPPPQEDVGEASHEAGHGH